MKTEITTDLKKATFQAKREFEAELALVWRAWTDLSFLISDGHPNPGSAKLKAWTLSPVEPGYMKW